MVEAGIAILAIFAPFMWMIMTRRWRATLFGVMILMVFEGAVRKWILPEFQSQIYFVKDALLVLAIIGFLSERHYPGAHEPLLSGLKALLGASLIFDLLQIANPYSPSPLLGLLGLKSYLLYAAFLFMVPYAFVSPQDMEHKLNIYMLLMIPVALLGLAQFAAPTDSWLNTQVAHDLNSETFVARFGDLDRARASGTFSYIGGFATFIEAMFLLPLAFVLSGQRGIRRNWIALALLTACTLGMFTTGSRTVVWGVLAMTLIMVLLCLRAQLISTVNAIRLTMGGLVIAGALSYFGQDSVDAFQHRAQNSDDPILRLLSPITELMGAFDVSPIFGLGIGVTANAGASIMGTSNLWWLHGHLFEIETARVMQEVGLIGFVLVYAVRIALLSVAVGMVQRLRTPLFKALSAAIASFFVLHLGLFVINNPTAGLYYWFGAGLLFAMYRLDYEKAGVSRPQVAALQPHTLHQIRLTR